MTKLDNDLISRKALLEVLSNLSVKNITDGDTYELVENFDEVFKFYKNISAKLKEVNHG